MENTTLPYPESFAKRFVIHASPGNLRLVERATSKYHGTYQAQWQIIEKLAKLYSQSRQGE